MRRSLKIGLYRKHSVEHGFAFRNDLLFLALSVFFKRPGRIMRWPSSCPCTRSSIR